MKLGIIGSGKIVTEILSVINQTGWTPTALCSTKRSEEKAKELAKQYSIPHTYTELSEMLKEDLDAVYIGTPNMTHAALIRQTLEAGKNVIVEKPVTADGSDFEELVTLAKEKGLFLFEAISTLYLPMYQKTKELLPQIGEIKLVSANFSQYSSRYDRFKAGDIAPVFDPKQAGGALMDLQIYNLHWMLGLLGKPLKLSYAPNIERDIDTSGILTLSYPEFQAVSLAAKDCAAPPCYLIQGTKGYLRLESTANGFTDLILHRNDSSEEFYEDKENSGTRRLIPEFNEFSKQISSKDKDECYKTLEHSLITIRLLTKAREDAGIEFR